MSNDDRQTKLIEDYEAAKNVPAENRSDEQKEAVHVYRLLNDVPKNEKLACIDLEASNNEDIAAIGVVVGDNKGVTQKVMELYIREEDLHFSTSCRTDFWEKNPIIYDKIKNSKRTKEEQISEFIDFWDSNTDKNTQLLSNNPEFDYGRLSRYVKKIKRREPIRYTPYGDYRSISDLGEASWQIGVYDLIKKKTSEIVPHNHLPSNDAENIFISSIATQKLMLAIRKKFLLDIREFSKIELQKIFEEIKEAREKADDPVVIVK